MSRHKQPAGKVLLWISEEPREVARPNSTLKKVVEDELDWKLQNCKRLCCWKKEVMSPRRMLTVLYCRLEHYGIKGIANSWFYSDLKNRRQTTQVSPYIFKTKASSCGVPQDSVLGPLFFFCCTQMRCTVCI